MDDSQASGCCIWGMEVLVTETRTLERGGKRGGGVHSHVGVPYLTDEETEALRAELNAVFWQRSQSFFPLGFPALKGEGCPQHSVLGQGAQRPPP